MSAVSEAPVSGIRPRFDLEPWARDVEYLTREHRESRAAELMREGRSRARGWAEHVKNEFTDAAIRAGFHEGRGTACDELPPDIPTLGDARLPSTAQNKGAWHFSRARGHRERFDRLASCSKEEMVEIRCENCGHEVQHAARCRVALVCSGCRGYIGNEKRTRLAINRRCAIHMAWTAGLLKRRRGGRWSEKLFTLTLPDTPELSVTGRIKLLRIAVAHFTSGLNAWLRRHPVAGAYRDLQGRSLARWFRNAEWTPGHTPECPAAKNRDAHCRCSGRPGGHPHAHFWFLGPYLPGGAATDDPKTNLLRNLWRDALRQAAHTKVGRRDKLFPELAKRWGPSRLARLGRRADVTRLPPEYWRDEIAGLDQMVVDVRVCKPGKKSLQEVVKYLFKDFVAGGRRLSPERWAEVYEGYDGTRTTQGSRGLMTLAARERALAGYLVDGETGELTEIPRPLDPHVFGDLRAPGHECEKCRRDGRWVEGLWVSLWRRRRRPMSDAERAALAARRPLAKRDTSIGLPFTQEVAV